MKKFIIKENKYLKENIVGFYNRDYIGYKQKGNPDFINKLKNMSKKYSELDLVEDFIAVCEIVKTDLKSLIQNSSADKFSICVVPRSKKEHSYSNSQLLFKKAISSVASQMGFKNGTYAIKRIKDTKTTHNWRLGNNTGETPYVGITKDTCCFDKSKILGENIILIDDIYTDGVYVCDDCIQSLLDLGAKNVILYVVAKTRG